MTIPIFSFHHHHHARLPPPPSSTPATAYVWANPGQGRRLHVTPTTTSTTTPTTHLDPATTPKLRPSSMPPHPNDDPDDTPDNAPQSCHITCQLRPLTTPCHPIDILNNATSPRRHPKQRHVMTLPIERHHRHVATEWKQQEVGTVGKDGRGGRM